MHGGGAPPHSLLQRWHERGREREKDRKAEPRRRLGSSGDREATISADGERKRKRRERRGVERRLATQQAAALLVGRPRTRWRRMAAISREGRENWS